MHKASRIAVGALAVLGALFLLVQVGAPLLMRCEETPFAVAESPNAKYIAVATNKRCKDSAKSGVYVHVWNADRTHGAEILWTPPTTTDIRLTWSSDKLLHVSYPEGLKVREGAAEFDEIEIRIGTFESAGT